MLGRYGGMVYRLYVVWEVFKIRFYLRILGLVFFGLGFWKGGGSWGGRMEFWFFGRFYLFMVCGF